MVGAPTFADRTKSKSQLHPSHQLCDLVACLRSSVFSFLIYRMGMIKCAIMWSLRAYSLDSSLLSAMQAV